jgi:sarcosine oxidase subunit beta
VPLGSDASRRDGLMVGAGFGAADALRFLAGTPRGALPRPRRIGVTETVRLLPAVKRDGLRGALLNWDGQLEDDARLVIALARTAASYGARILTRVAATGPDSVRDELTGQTLQVRARHVVNATGAWAAKIGAMAGAPLPVWPLRRHIFIAAPPLQGRPASGWTFDRRTLVIDFATSFYFHREGANLLFGMGDPSEAPGFDTTVNWQVLEQIAPVAARRLPALSDASIAKAWAGLYEMTPDAMPVIGRAGVDGLFAIAGFSGHGFQHSPAAGRILADVIAGRDPDFDLSPFRFDRFGDGTATSELGVV